MHAIIDYLYLGAGLIFIAGFFWMLFSMSKDIKMGRLSIKKNVSDHEIIQQQIKLADGKVVDLEIRVKVLEDRR